MSCIWSDVLVQLNQYLDAFQDFYLRKHSGRKLTWQPNLGHCQLKAVFPQVSGAHFDSEAEVSPVLETGMKVS